MKTFQTTYEGLQVILDELLEWVMKEVCRLSHPSLLVLTPLQQFKKAFPEEYEEMEAFIDVCPGYINSPAYPFGSLVLNINVRTRAHRDIMDKSFCVTIVIGEFSGEEEGDIVFEELGIQVRMRCGWFNVFESTRLTHFNMPYQGIRLSLVLSTDRHTRQWVINFKGWSNVKSTR